MFEVVSDLGVNQLRKMCYLYIVDHLPKLNKDDLSALPVELLLEICQHPAAVISWSEKEMLQLLWNKVKPFRQQKKNECIIKILEAVHLPEIKDEFLLSLLTEVRHIPRAKELIADTRKETPLSETREWYLLRCRNACLMEPKKCGDKPIEVKGITVREYSCCILIEGFPFFMYATSANGGNNEKEYYADSPWPIERMGLSYKVILKILVRKGGWVSVTTYYNGVVDKRPVDKSDRSIGPQFGFELTVRFRRVMERNTSHIRCHRCHRRGEDTDTDSDTEYDTDSDTDVHY